MARGSEVLSSVPQPNPDDATPPEGDETLPPEGDEPEEPDAVEARARAMGWKPLAEYRGPPGKWSSAEDFIAKGETILPVMRDQNRRMAERLVNLEGEVTGLRATSQEQLTIIKEMRELGRKADQRGYDRAVAEIKAAKLTAVESGDKDAYQRLDAQEEALVDAHEAAMAPPTPETPPRETKTPPPPDPAVAAFMRENTWFNKDAFLTRKVTDINIDVIEEFPDMSVGEQLDESLTRLKEAYPERFDMPKPRQTPPRPRPRVPNVATPTLDDRRPQQPNPLTINSITDPTERAQAREAFNRTKRQIPDYTEKEYMTLYADPKADVLEVQRESRSKANGR